MTESHDNTIPKRFGMTILCAGIICQFVGYLAIRALNFTPGTVPAIVTGSVGLVLIFTTFGVMLVGLWVHSGVPLTWRQFVRLSVDIALMPAIIPTSMVLVGFLVGFPIGSVTQTPFGFIHASMLGAEFGLFTVFCAMPFLPFAWPVLHRVSRCQRERGTRTSGSRFALPPLGIAILFAASTIPILLTSPTIAFFLTYLSAWVVFYALYRFVLYERFPRFNW